MDRYGARLSEDHLLTARLPNGCQLRCDLRDHVQRQIWFNGAYEPIETYLFAQLLRPGMTVIDAGANVGQYSLIAATAVGPTGQVHSFEPVPATFARLKEHVELNQLGAIITINQAALWNQDAMLDLGLADEFADNIGSYSVGAASNTRTQVSAPGVRLATYAVAAGLSALDLIKMDIEGAEPFALAGGIELLREHRPLILLEVNREALEALGSDARSLWGLLSGLGYRAWRIGSTLESCGPIESFDDLNQANVLLHHEPLPVSVTSGWTHRSVLRWSRKNV
jgi:FkbM family methyltransferase